MFYVKDFELKIGESMKRLAEVQTRLSSLEAQVSSLAVLPKRPTMKSQMASSSLSLGKPKSLKKPNPVVVDL